MMFPAALSEQWPAQQVPWWADRPFVEPGHVVKEARPL